MAKQIIFTYEGKDYTLEYTRRTVQQMEAEGFVGEDVEKRPMTLLPALFAGAFKAHHRFVKQEVIDKILRLCLIKRLLSVNFQRCITNQLCLC